MTPLYSAVAVHMNRRDVACGIGEFSRQGSWRRELAKVEHAVVDKRGMSAGFAEDWDDPFSVQRILGALGADLAPSIYAALGERDTVCLNATRSIVSLHQRLQLFDSLRERFHPSFAPLGNPR